jgi:hypothetical protein
MLFNSDFHDFHVLHLRWNLSSLVSGCQVALLSGKGTVELHGVDEIPAEKLCGGCPGVRIANGAARGLQMVRIANRWWYPWC